MNNKIIEIWGNGESVIIKYKKEGFNNIFYAAKHWPRNCSNLNDNWLAKCGYRRLKYEQ